MMTLARTALLASVALAALAGGCASDSQGVDYATIANDLSPELVGLTERPVDRYSHRKFAWHLERRMLSDDIQRFFYLDHPSHLSPYPVKDLSGQPR